MPTRNVDLTEHFDRLIESSVKSGRFSDANEVVKEGLRLLEQREQEQNAKLEWLRGAVQEGLQDLEDGNSVTLTTDEDIEGLVDEVFERVAGKIDSQKKRG